MFRPEDEYPNFPVLPRQLFRAKSLDETFACTYAERDPRHLAIVGNTAVTVMFGPPANSDSSGSRPKLKPGAGSLHKSNCQ